MRSTITISVPQKVRAELDRVCKAEGLSRSEVVRASIQDYLFVRQFRSMRKSMVRKAARAEVYTDQDVFDRVS